MSFSILRAILSEPWLMDKAEGDKYLPLLANLLSGKHSPEEVEPATLQVAAAGVAVADFREGFNYKVTPGTTAIIPVTGPILKYSVPCGQVGIDRISFYAESAKRNPDISSVLFVYDSGGGQAAGVQEFNAIVRSIGKPTLSLVRDGVLGSAALWMASASDEIWATTDTCIIGSIGAMITLADMRPKLEKEGIILKDFYATKSTRKNKTFRDALDGKPEGLIKGLVDPFQQAFEQGVRTYRGDRITDEEVYEGDTYLSPEALKKGLIDRIASMDEAIAYLQSKAEPNTQSTQFSNNSTQTDMKFKTGLKAVLAAIGFGSVTSEEEAPLVTEERLEQLNGSLEQANTSLAEKETELTELKSSLQTAQESLAAAEKERDEAQAKADQYGKQAGAAHSTPKKDKVEGGNDEKVKSEEEVFASYDHNQEALNEIKNI